MTELLNFISALGFPSAMCIMIYIFQNKTIEELKKAISQMDKSIDLLTDNVKTLSTLVVGEIQKGENNDH